MKDFRKEISRLVPKRTPLFTALVFLSLFAFNTQKVFGQCELNETEIWSGIGEGPFISNLGGIDVSIDFDTPDANTQIDNVNTGEILQTFNPTWFSEPVAGGPALRFEAFWDISPDGMQTDIDPATDDKGTGMMTITFSEPVTCAILHVDRLGGAGADLGNSGDSNSTEWTVTTPGVTLQRLSGTSDFNVTSTTFFKTPDIPNTTTLNGEATDNPSTGTSAGSIKFVSATPITNVSFDWTGIGVEGTGSDAVEFAISAIPTSACQPIPILEKSIANVTALPNANFTVDYELLISNDGDSSLVDISLIDDIATQYGCAFQNNVTTPVVVLSNVSGNSVAPTANASYDASAQSNMFIGTDGVLFPGDEIQVTFSIEVDPNCGGVDSPLINSATVSGTEPYGSILTDISDDPEDTAEVDVEGDGEPDDPTRLDIPRIELSKTADGSAIQSPAQVGDLVSYTFEVCNTGNVDLINVLVTDPIVTVNGTLIASLPIGACDAVAFTGTYALTAMDITNGIVINNATSTGIGNGVTLLGMSVVTDLSDDTVDNTNIDPDNDGDPDDPTVVLISQAGMVAGSVFADTNNDGSGDIALVGITIQLQDLNGNIIATTITDGSGNYLFSSVAMGDYILVQINQAGFVDVTDFDITSEDATDGLVNADNMISVTVIAGESDTGNNFVDTEPGSISGTVFGDTDLDALGDLALNGIVINLLDVNGAFFASVTTDASGNYIFNNIPPGQYTLEQINLSNYIDLSDFDTSSEDINDGSTIVDSRISVGLLPGEADADNAFVDQIIIAAVAIEKVGDGSALQAPTQVGDIITYTFEICNTGNQDLTNIFVTDPLVVVSGGPLGSLPIGQCDNSTFTASYAVTTPDIMAEEVVNQATVNAFDPGGMTVTDLSDDPEDPTDNDLEGDGEPDDPTVVPLSPAPSIVLEKVGNGSALQVPTQIGDMITYSFEVCNNGNVDLTNVMVTDPLITVSGGPILNLPVDACDAVTFTGTYPVTADDLIIGVVENQATVLGLDPNGNDVTDVSDDPMDLNDIDPDMDGDPDDPTVVPLDILGSISLEKTADASAVQNPTIVGDVITYTFEVCNTGNVDLSNVTLMDPIIIVNGGPLIVLAAGTCNSTAFTGTYDITEVDIMAGTVENQAQVTGLDPDGEEVTDLSDDPTDTTNVDPDGDGNPDDPTVVPLNAAASITLEKIGNASAVQSPAQQGDIITYTFEVCNTGNVPLTNIMVTDPLITVSGGTVTSLAVGDCDALTYTGTYSITQSDIVNGEVENQATVTGMDPDGNDVMDTSDDPNDFTDIDPNGDGEPDDPTVVPLTMSASISLIKEADDSAIQVPAQAGDVISYTFEVCNTGNVDLTNIIIEDPLVTVVGGPIAMLPVGMCDELTFTGSYTITGSDIANGEIENQATVTGMDPENNEVTDTSDDPNDLTDSDPNGDGEPDDPTVVPLSSSPSISLTKTADASAVQTPAMVGDIITYKFEVCNTGNVDLTNVVINDPLVTVSGGPLMSLAVGDCDAQTFTATYAITISDISAGVVLNQATATGQSPDGEDVTDTSDDPNDLTDVDPDGDGNPDDPTEVPLNQAASIAVEKVADASGIANPAMVGNVINYAFEICNTGNVTLTNIILLDPDVVLFGTPIPSLAPGACDATRYSGTYTLTASDVEAGMFINSAMVGSQDPMGNSVVDVSDDPTNPTNVDPNGDGNPDDPTVVTYSNCECPTIPGTLTENWVETAAGVYESDVNGNTVTFDVGVSGNSAISAVPNGTFSGLGFDYWTNPATIGINSLETLFTWDTNPEGFQTDIDAAGDDKGTGTLEICFDQPVLNPVIHIDRLGGAGSQALPITNSAEFVLTTPGLSLTRLSGTSDFEVSGGTIRKTPDVMGTISNPEATNMAEDGTAAGSIVVNGLVTCVAFSWTGVGVEGNGSDGIEWAFGTLEECMCEVVECDELVCNGDIQISLNRACELEVTADMVLEDPEAFGDYVIEFFDADGNSLGNVLTGDQADQTLTYQVSCDGNICWGEATIEANIIPEIDAPCACNETGVIPNECRLWCGSDDAIPGIIVTLEEAEAMFGACGPELLGNILVKETREGDICSDDGEVITITYTGKIIRHGRVEEIDILCQSYSVQKLDLGGSEAEFNQNFGFPNDLILECGTGSSPQEIYEATMDLTNAFPYYIDMHNLVVDTTFNIDTIQVIDESQQITRDTMVEQDVDGDGTLEWVLVTVVDKGFKDEIVIDTVLGDLENPAVAIKNQVCNVLITYNDLEFEACGNGIKIIREWTMVDWCDDSITRSERQTIEIRDKTAPTVVVEENGELVPVTMLNDLLVSIEPWTCSAKTRLPDINIVDNCDEAPMVDWFSAEGRIDEGFIFDLWKDQGPILVVGQVSDDCGNISEVSFNVIVIDMVPPVPIAETEIQVSLTGGLNEEGGIAKVYAEMFDEGSHDAGCGEVELYVVRMDDWTQPVVDCQGNIMGYQPTSCHPQTESVDLGQGGFKEEGCEFTGDNVQEITALGDFVKFCCADVGQEVMVILIVKDAAGNTNQAMIAVQVVDKAAPSMLCENIEIDCEDDIDEVERPRLIGGLCASDEYNIELLSESDRSGACNSGSIVKEWFVDLDGDGALSPGDLFCEQVISITDESSRFDPYTIKWPKHHDGLSVVGSNLECNALGDVIETSQTVDMGDELTCMPDDEGSMAPAWCDTACGLIGYSMEQDTIQSGDACLKIIKRWTVVDWCVYESNGDDVDDENDTDNDQFEAVEDWAQGVCADCDNGNGPAYDDPVYFRYTDVDEDGYYTFDQVIKVVDDTKPQIQIEEEIVYVDITNGAESKDDTSPCFGSSIISASATDFCGASAVDGGTISWEISVTNGFGEPVNNAAGVSVEYATGSSATIDTRNGVAGDIYTVEWIVYDACGNSEWAATTVIFRDRKPPTPFCVSGLTTAYMDTDGTVTVWGQEFDFGSFDNCCPSEDLRFTVVKAGETPAQPGDVNFSSQAGITFDCADMEDFNQLDVWVWDCDGNGDFCTVGILVQGDCPGEGGNGSGAMIAGEIRNHSGDMVQDVLVSVLTNAPEYPISMNTQNDGQFAFGNNPLGLNYSLGAIRDDNHSNGVSTIDLVMMQQHILGEKYLETPYQMIAADVSNDQRVSSLDIFSIKTLILGVADGFDKNTSWRFVSSNQNFDDPSEPWPFEESRTLLNLQESQMSEDFIGVKIGDVSGNAQANNLMAVTTRSTDVLNFVVSDQAVSSGEIIKVPVTSDNFDHVFGFQFTMDLEGFELLDIQSDILEVTEHDYAIIGNHLTMSWHSAVSVDANANAPIFNITLKASESGTLSNGLRLSSSITSIEAYKNQSLDVNDIALRFIDQSGADIVSSLELFQNEPNPFDNYTTIGFSIPEAGLVDVTITDVAGRVLHTQSGTFNKGINEIIINKTDIGQSGLLYYKIENNDNVLIKKMIVLN